MAIINQHSDKTVQWKQPAETLPADSKLCGIIRKTISGDSVIASTQLGAGDFVVQISMLSMSDMRLPSVECSYSYRTVASAEDRTAIHGGSTTNTVTSDSVTVRAGKSISASVAFLSDGQGTINVALRGAGQGIYQVSAKIYKIVQEKACLNNQQA